MSKPRVIIYSDGGCRPNPGTGGWGAVLLFEIEQKELSGGEKNSTNNRMELTAVITALDSLDQPYHVELYTDSNYVKKGITEWLEGWIRKNWRTATGQPVQNQDLWERLQNAIERHTISWKWVKGHAGNTYNERVDQLATMEIAKLNGKPFVMPAPKIQAESKADVKIYVRANYNYDMQMGGWGVVILNADGQQELKGTERNSSENQIVLKASLKALDAVDPASSVAVFTTSEYLQKGMSQWVKGWAKKGWRTASGGPVKNQELWEQLLEATQKRQVEWIFSNEAMMGNSKRAVELATEHLR